MDLAALLKRYQTLLPWNLARTKCFVSNDFREDRLRISSTTQDCPWIYWSCQTKICVCTHLYFLKNIRLWLFWLRASHFRSGSTQGPSLSCSWSHKLEFSRIDINLLVLPGVVANQFSIPILWKALPKKGTIVPAIPLVYVHPLTAPENGFPKELQTQP